MTLAPGEKKLLVGLFVMAGLAFALVLFSWNIQQRISANAAEIKVAGETKLHLSAMLLVGNDMETGMRGFVITGDEKYLHPSNKAIASVYLHFDRLRNAVSGSVQQLYRIHDLERLMDEKISANMLAIELRRQKGLEAATFYIASGKGMAIDSRIHALTATMLQEEDAILAQLEKENTASIRQLSAAYFLMAGIILLFILGLFLLIRRYASERRKSEGLLREEREMLRAIMDNTSSLICIKDLAGRYLHVNKQYETLFQVTDEIIKGKTDAARMPEKIADAVRDTDLETLRNKRHMEFEEDLAIHGEIRHYIAVKFPLFDKGVANAVCSVYTDITGRKQAETLLKARSDSILDLFNNAPCGYHTLDKNGVIIEMNETELGWLGYEREEVAGKMHVSEILSEESRRVFEYHFSRLMNKTTQHIHDLEIRMKRKNDSMIAVLINVAALYDENGDLLRTRSSVFDITLRKQAESIYSQN